MQAMIWAAGRCTNAPAGWAITVHRAEYGTGWRYCASRNSGFGGIDDEGHLTERAAQLAAEASCWRNGILPLPAWTKHGRHWECHRIGDMTYRAEVGVLRGQGRVQWVYVANRPTGTVYDWRGATRWAAVDAAKTAAERHLRCEIAAALEAEAAKEGQP